MYLRKELFSEVILKGTLVMKILGVVSVPRFLVHTGSESPCEGPTINTGEITRTDPLDLVHLTGCIDKIMYERKSERKETYSFREELGSIKF